MHRSWGERDLGMFEGLRKDLCGWSTINEMQMVPQGTESTQGLWDAEEAHGFSEPQGPAHADNGFQLSR